MASEDPDQVLSGLLAVHRLRDLRDLNQTLSGQMTTAGDAGHAISELQEVLLLGAPHGIRPKERNDLLEQILTASHDVAMQVLSVVVVALVDQHLTHTEEIPELV